MTDVQNTGIRYAERARQTLLEWGRLSHIAARGRAEIRFAAESPHSLVVHRLSMSGKRLGRVETQIRNNPLTFTADTALARDAATFFYELVRE